MYLKYIRIDTKVFAVAAASINNDWAPGEGGQELQNVGPHFCSGLTEVASDAIIHLYNCLFWNFPTSFSLNGTLNYTKLIKLSTIHQLSQNRVIPATKQIFLLITKW